MLLKFTAYFSSLFAIGFSLFLLYETTYGTRPVFKKNYTVVDSPQVLGSPLLVKRYPTKSRHCPLKSATHYLKNVFTQDLLFLAVNKTTIVTETDKESKFVLTFLVPTDAVDVNQRYVHVVDLEFNCNYFFTPKYQVVSNEFTFITKD